MLKVLLSSLYVLTICNIEAASATAKPPLAPTTFAYRRSSSVSSTSPISSEDTFCGVGSSLAIRNGVIWRIPEKESQKKSPDKEIKKRSPKAIAASPSPISEVDTFGFEFLAACRVGLLVNPCDPELMAHVEKERARFYSNSSLYENIKAIDAYQKAMGII